MQAISARGLTVASVALRRAYKLRPESGYRRAAWPGPDSRPALTATGCAPGRRRAMSKPSPNPFRVPPTSRVLLLGLVVSVAGCAYRPAPIVLDAGPAEWRALIGTWHGSYNTASEKRRGLIDFSLAAGDKEAFGDVLMTAAGTHGRYNAAQHGAPSEGEVFLPHSTLLMIRFVRASDGRLMGATAPYWDADRQCEATATFYGAIGDGRMDGTFTSLCADGVHAVQGRWTVRRRSPTRP